VKNIKVLATGCANCNTTQKFIKEITGEKEIEIRLEIAEDIQAIMSYGVASSQNKIAGWL